MFSAVQRQLASSLRFAITAILAAQPQPARPQQTRQTADPRPMTYADRISVAKPILLHAESTAFGLSPDARALLLYRLGGAWYPLDHDHSIRLYRQAFDVVAESDSKFRGLLERAIIIDLIPISPPDALDLLPRGVPADSGNNPDSDGTKRNSFYGMLILYAQAHGDTEVATKAFDSSVDAGSLDEAATAKLLASLPAGASAERNRMFSIAVRYYEHSQSSFSTAWNLGLADLIARNYADLPASLMLLAIDQVLDDAQKVSAQVNGSASLGEGTLFHSPYDLQLFAVSPALRSLDPKRATTLLAQHSDVADALERYPQSIVSIEEAAVKGLPRTRGRVPLEFLLFEGNGPVPRLDAIDIGLEFTQPEGNNRPPVEGEGKFYAYRNSPEAKILDLTGPCPSDVSDVLEKANSVLAFQKVPFTCSGPMTRQWCSYRNTYPRADLIQAIAERCTYGNVAGSARLALAAQLKLLPQVLDEDRVKYLANAADLYLRLGDREAAARAVQFGFSAARAVLDENLKADKDKVPEGLWPAAESYRRLLALGVNSDLLATQAAVNAIPDPVLAEYERVMLARALLGIPVRMSMTGGAGGGYGWTEAGTTTTLY